MAVIKKEQRRTTTTSSSASSRSNNCHYYVPSRTILFMMLLIAGVVMSYDYFVFINNNIKNCLAQASSSSSSKTTEPSMMTAAAAPFNERNQDNTTTNNNSSNVDDGDDVNFRGGVVGVLTVPKNYHLRYKYRLTWMKDETTTTTTYNHQQYQGPSRRIRSFFLLDQETPEMALEQEKFGDIIFLNTTATGFAVQFGEKLYKWLTYAHTRFPNSSWVAKMDDDVAFCPKTTTTAATTTQTTATATTPPVSLKTAYVWDYIYENQSPMLYCGFVHDHRSQKDKGEKMPIIRSRHYRIDEMFVVLGSELVQRLSQRQYCNPNIISQTSCENSNGLWDTNHGGTSLGKWLEPYNAFGNVTITPLNNRIYHYDQKGPYPKASKQFCMGGKILYHKANASQMDAIWG